MVYGFDFTDNICYMSRYDGEIAEELPSCVCPVEIEKRIDFIEQTISKPEEKAAVVVESITKELLEAISGKEKIRLLSKEEAFAEYLLQQDHGVWKRNAAVFEFHKKSFCFYEVVRRGKMLMAEKEKIELPSHGFSSSKEKDKFFTKWAAEKLNHRQIAVVYLIGEEFEGQWMELSLASVCHGRRVFMGNHLFSTGAMLSVAKPLEKKEKLMTGDYHAYYWGIRAFHHGQKDVFVPIIQPGNFWFDTCGSIEVLLDGCKEMEIEGMHFISRQEIKLSLPLNWKQRHPMRTTKLKIAMICTGLKTIKVHVYDMGFGASRKGSGLIYEEEFKLP